MVVLDLNTIWNVRRFQHNNVHIIYIFKPLFVLRNIVVLWLFDIAHFFWKHEKKQQKKQPKVAFMHVRAPSGEFLFFLTKWFDWVASHLSQPVRQSAAGAGAGARARRESVWEESRTIGEGCGYSFSWLKCYFQPTILHGNAFPLLQLSRCCMLGGWKWWDHLPARSPLIYDSW